MNRRSVGISASEPASSAQSPPGFVTKSAFAAAGRQCVCALVYSVPRLPASLPLPARAGGLHRPQT